MAEDDDLLQEGREKFGLAADAENDNRTTFEADIRFGRNQEHWPEDVKKQRELEKRPCLTIDKLTAFTRQVINDARQNKPSIKVHPADSGADPDTADVINGLIRNIEYTSNADVAYDTAIDNAVNGGWGYIRVGLDYAYDDSFDMDLTIEAVPNALSIYGDPNSTAADSADWMDAFAVDRLSKSQFKAKYGKDTKTVRDWDDSSWGDEIWRDGNDVLVAEWWHRDEVEKKISQFLNTVTGELQIYANDDVKASEDLQLAIQTGLLVFKRERTGKAYETEQRIMTGAEIVKTNPWAGCYIPIIPVYGDEYNIKGKRYIRSLIHPAIDAQRNFDYWRSAATELVALAPRAPFIGRKGTFNSDIERWNTANTKNHPFLEYDTEPPQRQPLDVGPAAGALQEALNASDDMKATIGLYDASLGARSNETSGKAILARQREGDVSTFHFIDNRNRAIRHTGRVLIDLIPKVYTKERVIRVMGLDGKPSNVPIGKQYQKTDPKTGQPLMQPTQGPDGQQVMQPVLAMHDFSAGKYDLTVETGPSYTTQREEAVDTMTALIQAYPPAAPILGPELVRNYDWPGAEEIADKLEQSQQGQNIPPELQQKIEQGQKLIASQTQQIQDLQKQLDVAKQDSGNASAQLRLDAYNATTERMKVSGNLQLDAIDTILGAAQSAAPVPPAQAA